MNDIRLQVSELPSYARELTAGSRVLLTGTVYTARDAAHKRIAAAMDAGEALPFPLKGAAIYYAGPTAARPGMVIGSCGPTTSSRMDVYTPKLLDAGLCCMIGKGPRNQDTVHAMVRNGAVYFCALGGAGALACQCIKACEVIAYEELGCESVKRLYVEDFPLVTAIDAKGGSLF